MLSKTKDVTIETEILDLSLLSEQAKWELWDFYQFLLDRYGIKPGSAEKLPDKFYNPVKTKRYQ